MKITLPILFNTNSTQSLQDADIDFDLRECEIRNMTFYNIDAIADYFENDIEYSQIYYCNTSVYCTLKKNEVERMIDGKMKSISFEDLTKWS